LGYHIYEFALNGPENIKGGIENNYGKSVLICGSVGCRYVDPIVFVILILNILRVTFGAMYYMRQYDSIYRIHCVFCLGVFKK
jgi:hypothetical protein